MPWLPIDTAPKDGTPLLVKYEDGATEENVYWQAEGRCCVMESRAGAFPPGWTSLDIGNLPVSGMTHWFSAPHPSDLSGVLTLLPGNACENCSNTGLVDPALADFTDRSHRKLVEAFGNPPRAMTSRPDTGGDPEPCEYCGPGRRTGLPGNACENCMNTGLKYPTAEDL